MVWRLPQNSDLTWRHLADFTLKEEGEDLKKPYTFTEKLIRFISDAGSGWRLFPNIPILQ